MQPEPRIRSVKAVAESPSPQGFYCVARFDLELGPDVTLHGLRLVRTPTSSHQVYPADAKDGSRSAALAPSFRNHIADLVVFALEPSIVTTSATEA